jgi:hypothetical protein
VANRDPIAVSGHHRDRPPLVQQTQGSGTDPIAAIACLPRRAWQTFSGRGIGQNAHSSQVTIRRVPPRPTSAPSAPPPAAAPPPTASQLHSFTQPLHDPQQVTGGEGRPGMVTSCGISVMQPCSRRPHLWRDVPCQQCHQCPGPSGGAEAALLPWGSGSTPPLQWISPTTASTIMVIDRPQQAARELKHIPGGGRGEGNSEVEQSLPSDGGASSLPMSCRRMCLDIRDSC